MGIEQKTRVASVAGGSAPPRLTVTPTRTLRVAVVSGMATRRMRGLVTLIARVGYLPNAFGRVRRVVYPGVGKWQNIGIVGEGK